MLLALDINDIPRARRASLTMCAHLMYMHGTLPHMMCNLLMQACYVCSKERQVSETCSHQSCQVRSACKCLQAHEAAASPVPGQATG